MVNSQDTLSTKDKLRSMTAEQIDTARRTEGRNVVHEKGLIVGVPNEQSLMTQEGFTYRLVGSKELEDLMQEGVLLPPASGKSKGGRAFVKHWSRGGNGFFYPPNNDGTYIIEVPNERISTEPGAFVQKNDISRILRRGMESIEEITLEQVSQERREKEAQRHADLQNKEDEQITQDTTRLAEVTKRIADM